MTREEKLAAMWDRATDGGDHEWGWYRDDVPALINEIHRLEALIDTLQ